MNDILEKFNKVSVSLKNVLWLLGLVVFVVMFWATVMSHMNNTIIHTSEEKNLRIEKLEWDLRRLQEQSLKRYNRLKAEFAKIKSK